ncbi:hypothetical protein MTR72_25965 [Bradyrhizobium sp. ISRA442]|uniref:hypothetical protein n=1 Tax=Bradyrhizobium sp. ISRA442 TaxID=2866197 RepID=UPI00311B2D1F
MDARRHSIDLVVSMEEFRSIVARFPQRELDIRRRFGRDASFRSICSDYEEATKALRHWQKTLEEADPERDRRVKEYNHLLVELEEEILAYLSRP